jgi:hypothetical protein
MKSYLRGLHRLLKARAMEPRVFNEVIYTVPFVCSAYRFSRAYTETVQEAGYPCLFVDKSTLGVFSKP